MLIVKRILLLTSWAVMRKIRVCTFPFIEFSCKQMDKSFESTSVIQTKFILHLTGVQDHLSVESRLSD